MTIQDRIYEYICRANGRILLITEETTALIDNGTCGCEFDDLILEAWEIFMSITVLRKSDYNLEEPFGYPNYLIAWGEDDAERLDRINSYLHVFENRYNLIGVVPYEFPGFYLRNNLVNLCGCSDSCVETDPLFLASPAATITLKDICNWNDAFSWGDHALAGYLKEQDVYDLTDLRYVRFDINNQGLNPTQKQNARTNISSVSIDTVETISGKKTFSLSPTSGTQSQDVFDLVRRDELRLNPRQNANHPFNTPLSIGGDPATKLTVINVTASGTIGQVNRLEGAENGTMRVYAQTGTVRILNGVANSGDFTGFDIGETIDIPQGQYRDFVLIDDRWRKSTHTESLSWVTNNFYPLNSNPAGYLTNSALPFGLEGQIYKINQDNSNILVSQDNVLVGNYITTDDQLNESKDDVVGGGIFTSFSDIFNTWRRFSHGTTGSSSTTHLGPGDDLPANVGATTSWSYNSVTDAISSTINSGTYVGFISPLKYNGYDHRATLSSTANDNDLIALVIAFHEDTNDMVTNLAFGLNPVTYPGINVTDPLIPNQHTISLVRTREIGMIGTRYAIVYDYHKSTQKILANGNSLVWGTNSNWSGQSVDVRVLRDGDNITVWTSEFSDAPGGKGSLSFPLEFNLNSDVDTIKFKGGSNYGYSAHSQPSSTFTDVSVTGIGINEIYDHRNGDIWIADSLGNWSIDLTRNLWDILLSRSITFNPKYSELVWHIRPEEFLILNSSSNFGVQSVGLSAPSIFNVSGSPVTGTGTLSLSLANQSEYTVFARGVGSGVPSFISLSQNHLPNGIQLSKLQNITGPTILGRVSGTGAISVLTPSEIRSVASVYSISEVDSIVAGYTPSTRNITINGTTQNLTADRTWSVGTVTSIGLSLPSIFSVTGSPVTVSGTLTASLASQSAWTVFARGSGSGAPSFQSLDINHLPGSIPLTKLENISGPTILGRLSGNGSIQQLSASDVRTIASVYSIAQVDSLLTGYVPVGRTITINGTAFDLSTNRAWSVGTVTSIATNNGVTGGTITASGTIGLTGQALALHNLATNGLIVRTGSGTVTARSLSAGTGIEVSNSDGVSGNPSIAFSTTWGDARYVTITTAQTITGLKTIQRSGEVLNFGNGSDSLYQLKLVYSQNEVEVSGEATWSFENKFNRNSSGFTLTPLSFFRGVLVTGQRLLTASISTNLVNYYISNPSGTYPISAYHTRVHQYANGIIVGDTTGRVNESTGAIADLPSGVIANFKGRVKGTSGVDADDFVTVSQLGGGGTWGSITGTLSSQTDLQAALDAKANNTITISSGTGLTGGGNLTANRTLSLTGQALALHNLATNGLIARTGSGTVSARTITAGTGISVTNGDGVSGDPTIEFTSAFGLGTLAVNNTDFVNQSRFIRGTDGTNPFGAFGAGINIAYGTTRTVQFFITNFNSAANMRAFISGEFDAARQTQELWHGGNLRSDSDNDGRYVLKAGDTMTGALTIATTTAAPRLILNRTDNTINTSVEFRNTTNSVFAGQGDNGWFAIGAANDIRIGNSGVFRVNASTGVVESKNALFLEGGSANSTWTNAEGQIALKASSQNPYISFHATTGARNAYIQYVNDEGLRFFNTTSSNLRIGSVLSTDLLVRGANGAVGTPAYSFTGDTDTGLYWIAANDFGITTGGTIAMRFSSVIRSQVNHRFIDGTAASPSLTFDSDTNTGIYRIGADILGFSTNGTYRARIDATGNLLVGTTGLTGGGVLQVNGIGRFNGDVIAFSTSDKRFKDNLEVISSPINKLMRISGYSFEWNNKQDYYFGKDYGVIAQEIKEVMPEIVTTRENGYLAVKYEKIVPLLIESIKELKREIETLKSK
jgi:hypothetical protein